MRRMVCRHKAGRNSFCGRRTEEESSLEAA
jgi:hypothetical protein